MNTVVNLFDKFEEMKERKRKKEEEEKKKKLDEIVLKPV